MAERKMPNPEDFPSNSDTKSEKPERVNATQSIVKGKVKSKESGLRKIRDEFISEDAPNVGSYILYDVMLPAIKDLILDIGHGAIDVAFGGTPGGYRRRRDYGHDRSYISYDRMYDDRRDRRRTAREERRVRDRLEDLVFEYREDAEDVLDRMLDYLDEYEDYGVPVAYYYDLCGKTVPHDFTKEDWGWTNLSSAKVCRARGGGYYIDLPRVRPL